MVILRPFANQQGRVIGIRYPTPPSFSGQYSRLSASRVLFLYGRQVGHELYFCQFMTEIGVGIEIREDRWSRYFVVECLPCSKQIRVHGFFPCHVLNTYGLNTPSEGDPRTISLAFFSEPADFSLAGFISLESKVSRLTTRDLWHIDA